MSKVIKRNNLDDAMNSSLIEARIDVEQKVLTIDKKVDRFKVADRVMSEELYNLNLKPITNKPKLGTKVINLTERDNKRLDDILDRFMLQKLRVNKSEILRMGLIALEKNFDSDLKNFLGAIEKLKP